MSAYNHVLASVRCPCCGATVDVAAECKLGSTSNMLRLRVGDEYPWVPRKAVQNGGRPPDGTIIGDAYAECPECDKDFFLCVHVQEDRIVRVVPDPDRRGYKGPASPAGY